MEADANAAASAAEHGTEVFVRFSAKVIDCFTAGKEAAAYA
jgi:hypothetical protein